tara:strand:+ start:252 stop:485 length:234 start_codon:yes stop_codon:yes gene_type:complete
VNWHWRLIGLLCQKNQRNCPKPFGHRLYSFNSGRIASVVFAANPDNPNDTAEIVDLFRKYGGKTGSGGKAELKAEGK